jgi:hypothetical protein
MQESAVENFLFSFWWLIFPIMWFVFGFFGMFLRYRRHRDAMDLLKTYASQGKEPPAEVSKILSGQSVDDANCNGWGGGYGYYGWRGRRYGPYWEWRRVFIFASLAIGFGVAAYYGEDWGVHGEPAFIVVAAVMGCLAIGSLIFALMARRLNGDDK